jgi:hypothetical protein
MIPLPDARISDLGPNDELRVRCACQSLTIFPRRYLLEGLKLRPDDRIVDLAPRMRCRQCGERGKVVVSVRS